MKRAAVLALVLAGCTAGGGVETPGARGLSADAGGLQPAGTTLRIDFGRHQPGTVAAVSRLLGTEPVASDARTGCRGGPMTEVRWANGLALFFRDGTFLGWSAARGRGQPVAAPGGLAPGTPAASLAAAPAGETAPGPVVRASGVSALIADGAVDRIWAGETCTLP